MIGAKVLRQPARLVKRNWSACCLLPRGFFYSDRTVGGALAQEAAPKCAADIYECKEGPICALSPYRTCVTTDV